MPWQVTADICQSLKFSGQFLQCHQRPVIWVMMCNHKLWSCRYKRECLAPKYSSEQNGFYSGLWCPIYLKPLRAASYTITHTHCYLETHKHSCYHKNIDSRLPPPSCLANQFSFLPYMSWFLAACVCVTRGMLCVCVSLHSFPPPPLLKSTQHVVIH